MWFVWWVRRSLDTPPSDVIPPLAKALLLGRWIGPLSFRSGTFKTAPCNQNFMMEATPRSSANQAMAEQTGQQATCI